MKSVSAVCAAITMALPAAVLAQAPAADDTIIVTGMKLEERLPGELAKYGTRVTTITSAQIKTLGALDATEALQSLAPGLFINPKNGPFDYVDISFQGSRTSEVLWLVDGIRINNRLYAGTTPLDTLPASLIERVEVLEGGQALFFGTQAAAGAINIVTKAFSESPDGALTLGGDTNGGKHADGYFRDKFGKHQIVLFASEDQSPGLQPYPDADFQPSSTDRRRSYDVMNLGGKYALSATDALTLTGAYQHTTAKLDFAAPARSAVNFNARDEDLASAKVDFEPSEAAKFYAKAYYHRWTSHHTQFDNVVGSPGTLTRIDDKAFWGFKDYGANLMTKLALNRGFEYFLGYDFQNYNGSDAVLLIRPQTENVHALFGQVRTTSDLIPNVFLSAGVRYNAPSVGKDAAVWNVSGQFIIVDDKLVLRGSVSTAFRLPTAEELFADDPNDELGNPNLKPERTFGGNASLSGKFDLGGPSLHWDVIGFYRRTKDLIDYDTFNAATNQDVFGNVTGRVISRGVEGILILALSDSFSANSSYTYTRSKRDTSALQFNRIPKTQFKTSLDYHPGDLPMGANLTFRYLGDVYDTLSGGIGRREYGSYAVLDVGARIFLDGERRHRISANVDNVLGRFYASRVTRGTSDTGASYLVHNLGRPRTLRATYSYQFE